MGLGGVVFNLIRLYGYTYMDEVMWDLIERKISDWPVILENSKFLGGAIYTLPLKPYAINMQGKKKKNSGAPKPDVSSPLAESRPLWVPSQNKLHFQVSRLLVLYLVDLG